MSLAHFQGFEVAVVNYAITGTNGCIGRALAIIEMRDLITAWIQNFESVRFAPGEDGSNLLLGTLDHFTVGVKPINLIFDPK